MQATSTIAVVNDAIARTQKRLDVLHQLRELVESDPGLLAELIASLTPIAGEKNGSGNGHVPPPGAGGYQKVRAYFLDRRNEWATAPQIIASTGLTKTNVIAILYKKGSRSRFEQKDHPTDGRLKLWRLTESEVTNE